MVKATANATRGREGPSRGLGRVGSAAREGSRWSDAAIGLLVLGRFLFLALSFSPAISTPDANRSMARAPRIAREGRADVVVESPAQYVRGPREVLNDTPRKKSRGFGKT
ncbi:MAG: hypothetical protein AB7I30_14785 [Isosphaeraceae bacterium]